MMVIVTMLATLQNETRSLRQKFDVLDFEKYLMTSLADGSICNRAVTDNTLTFNPSSLTGLELDIPELKASTDPAAPTLVGSGTAFGESGVKASRISFQSLSTLGVNRYAADMVINFDPANLVRSLKPIRLKQVLITVDDPGGKKIISCGLLDTVLTKSAYSPGVFGNLTDAVRYCRDLNEGGFSDWRFPTIAELYTFIGAPDVTGDFVWTDAPDPTLGSNTRQMYGPDALIFVRLSDAFMTDQFDAASKVLCVRGH